MQAKPPDQTAGLGRLPAIEYSSGVMPRNTKSTTNKAGNHQLGFGGIAHFRVFKNCSEKDTDIRTDMCPPQGGISSHSPKIDFSSKRSCSRPSERFVRTRPEPLCRTAKYASGWGCPGTKPPDQSTTLEAQAASNTSSSSRRVANAMPNPFSLSRTIRPLICRPSSKERISSSSMVAFSNCDT